MFTHGLNCIRIFLYVPLCSMQVLINLIKIKSLSCFCEQHSYYINGLLMMRNIIHRRNESAFEYIYNKIFQF